jgi:plastocyanin
MKTGILALVLALGSVQAGEINGRIVIGKPLTKQRLAFAPYQARGLFVASAGAKETGGEEFSRMAFYLEEAGLGAGKPITVELRQENRQFSAEVLVVPAGSTVIFSNGDPIFHNVFSLSKAKQFDLGYYPMNESRSQRLDRPGIVQVYCHIHREMTAAVVVAPSAWYGRPETNGRFLLSGVPAGMHELVVWHKSAGFFRQRVEVPAEGTVEVTIHVPLRDH